MDWILLFQFFIEIADRPCGLCAKNRFDAFNGINLIYQQEFGITFTFIGRCFNLQWNNVSVGLVKAEKTIEVNKKIILEKKPCGLEWQELVFLRHSRLPDCPRNWQWSHTFLNKVFVTFLSFLLFFYYLFCYFSYCYCCPMSMQLAKFRYFSAQNIC